MTRGVCALLLLLFVGASAAAPRVVALAPHLAELVCALDDCKSLVGVVRHSDYPPAVTALPQVGDAYAVNLEALLALQPELVLAWDGGTSPQVIERLRALKLNVHTVKTRTLDDVARALLELGELLGSEEPARVAAQRYRSGLAELRERHAQRPPVRVMYQIETQPAYSLNRDSPISEAIVLCGGINVFAELPQLAAPVGTEAVLAANPDLVVYGEQDDVAGIHDYWARLPARSGGARRLEAVDASLLARASPRMLLGVRQLCEAVERARPQLRDQPTSVPPASRASTRAVTNK